MDVEITELEKIDADRVDGVGSPANGIQFILMKQVDEPEAAAGPVTEDAGPEFDRDAAVALVKAIVGRKVDESPDIAGGTAVLAQIADLIIAEAQELKAGNAGEICDIQQLACAAEMIWCWRTGEEAVASGNVQPATALMQSAALKGLSEGIVSINDALAAFGLPPADLSPEGIAKAEHSADDRRKLAEQGNALSDGSYPITDEHDLHSAAVLARSGHGDAAAAKKLIARRAKELGVKNPLDDTDGTSKSAIADEGTSVDTVTQTGELTELVKDAVAKAMAPLEERLRALDAELAKANALPVTGGPVMSVVRPKTAADGEDHAAKAAYYEEWAEKVSAPDDADRYRQLAARERAKITS